MHFCINWEHINSVLSFLKIATPGFLAVLGAFGLLLWFMLSFRALIIFTAIGPAEDKKMMTFISCGWLFLALIGEIKVLFWLFTC